MYSTPIWHPSAQMKDYEQFAPLDITSAKNEFLYLSNGKKVIDAISSWWCKSLGHGHPEIHLALTQQLQLLEHTTLANTTNSIIRQLTEKLCHITKLDKVLFASDGACAVEIALKMSIHARALKNQPQKTQFIALSNGYHGETCATLSVSDLELYKAPYKQLMFDCYFIQNIPYVSGIHDPLWQNAHDYWLNLEPILEARKSKTNAIILEPLIQGAGGMLVYSKDFLQRLGNWCKNNDIYLILDEIMTGIGRTGKLFAFQHTDIVPDFLCLSKGLTAGVLPLSVMLTHEHIYALFYDDYLSYKAFMHSHTHSGNTLACAVALATLAIIEKENLISYVDKSLSKSMYQAMCDIANYTNKIHNVRYLGAMVSADIKNPQHARHGYKIYQKAIELGALLRPLGNTIYWLPPLNTSLQTIHALQEITMKALTV